MRNKNRVVISTGAKIGSRRLVETPNGNVIAETLNSLDSLGNPRWTRTKSDLNSFVQEIGTQLGRRIDTKARARRERYENNSRGINSLNARYNTYSRG